MPSPAYLVGALLFGIIGYVALIAVRATGWAQPQPPIRRLALIITDPGPKRPPSPGQTMKLNVYSVFLRRLMSFSVVVLGLSGCSTANETVTRWLSSQAEAIGVIDDRILRGQATFPNEREATIHLQSSDAGRPTLTCLGALRFTASNSGVVDFSCSDGRSLMMPFQSRSLLSGVGRGVVGNADFAWTYGLPSERAASFLGLPIERLMPRPTYPTPINYGGG